MTRINVGIPPRALSDKHLLAEHREIKRIPNALAKYGKALNVANIPKQFTLGTGHVRFFYDKGFYTFERYIKIYIECLKRGFNVTDYKEAWSVYEQRKELFNRYTETKQDASIVLARLIERDPSYKNKNID